MANIFDQIDSDVCVVTVQDVKDSLLWDFADGTLSDTEILKYIIRSQNLVNVYLISIRSIYTCDNLCEEEIPVNIKRAIVMTIEDAYESDTAAATVWWIAVNNLAAWAVVKESSCDTTIEYAQWVSYSSSSINNPCDDLPCDVANMLECYRVNSMSFKKCGGCFVNWCSSRSDQCCGKYWPCESC